MLTRSDLSNVLQNDAKELKDWTEIKLGKDASGERGPFEAVNIVNVWSAPKAWAFQVWDDQV